MFSEYEKLSQIWDLFSPVFDISFAKYLEDVSVPLIINLGSLRSKEKSRLVNQQFEQSARISQHVSSIGTAFYIGSVVASQQSSTWAAAFARKPDQCKQQEKKEPIQGPALKHQKFQNFCCLRYVEPKTAA